MGRNWSPPRVRPRAGPAGSRSRCPRTPHGAVGGQTYRDTPPSRSSRTRDPAHKRTHTLEPKGYGVMATPHHPEPLGPKWKRVINDSRYRQNGHSVGQNGLSQNGLSQNGHGKLRNIHRLKSSVPSITKKRDETSENAPCCH